MNKDSKITGIALKIGPLGEHDRLLTLMSERNGVIRLAIPGARRPKSRLSATTPFTFLELHATGKSSLKTVRQLKVLRSFSKVGQSIGTLAAAQAICELVIMLVGPNDPHPGVLNAILIHLERLEEKEVNSKENIVVLAKSVQSCIHLLSLGGYGLPIQSCCKTGLDLTPPIGQWDWKCSFIPEEGFAIGEATEAIITLNPSELALLQRLFQPHLPRKKDGEILGPLEVWIKLLNIIDFWSNHHLPHKIRSLSMLRDTLINE